MKPVHLSDLHIGKRVDEISMIEDQEYILNQIIRIIRDENADAVLLSGDIYDKSDPSAEFSKKSDCCQSAVREHDATRKAL